MKYIFILLFAFTINAKETSSLSDYVTEINDDLETGKSVEPERWSYINARCMGLFRLMFDYADEKNQKLIQEKITILAGTITMIDKRFQDIPASTQGGNAIFEIYKPFYDGYRKKSQTQYALDESYYSPEMMIDGSICRQYTDSLYVGLPEKGILN